MIAGRVKAHYIGSGSGCRLVAVPAFKAVRGAIALSLVGSIPTPSAKIDFLRDSPLQGVGRRIAFDKSSGISLIVYILVDNLREV